MTKLEAQILAASLGPGHYIYPHGHGSNVDYDVRRCPPKKTEEQRAAMAQTPQYQRVTTINQIASREYRDPYLLAEWNQRWRDYQRKRSRSKKSPYVTDEGSRIDSLWNFILVAMHWLRKTNTSDPLVPNRFCQGK